MGKWKAAPEPIARAGCDKCGPVTMPYSALTIRVCVETRDAEYRFVCPDCEMVQVTKIHPSMLHSLLSQPLTQEWFHEPLELGDIRRHIATPITRDDCADFMRELESM